VAPRIAEQGDRTVTTKLKIHKMQNQPGFSLVELIVGVTITAILLTMGLSAYRQAQNRAYIQAAKESILEILQSSQKQAYIGENDCTDSGIFEGVEVRVQTPSSISVLPKCAGVYGASDTHTLSNLTFQSSHTILFKPLGQGVGLGGTNSLDIIYQIYGNSYAVNITAPGNIRYLGEQ